MPLDVNSFLTIYADHIIVDNIFVVVVVIKYYGWQRYWRSQLNEIYFWGYLKLSRVLQWVWMKTKKKYAKSVIDVNNYLRCKQMVNLNRKEFFFYFLLLLKVYDMRKIVFGIMFLAECLLFVGIY